jgi:hypothetical protein
MENIEQSIVKFYGDEILVINGKVAVLRIAENIGLNTDSAVRGVKSHHILKSKVTVEYVLDAANRQFPMLCLPIEYLHGWLFSIDISKVKEEVREKLMKYQEECFHVLDAYFNGKFKVISNVQKIIADKKKRNKEINRMVNALMIEHKENATIIEQNSNITLQQLGFWEEEAEMTELPDQITGKQFFLKKA